MKTEEWRELPIVHLRLSDELDQIVDREASNLGMKKTEFVRFALISYLRSINVNVHPSMEEQPPEEEKPAEEIV